MSLKDYKIIKTSYIEIYSLERLQILVDDENLDICNTVDTDENIILELKNKFYLVENARMLFANKHNITVFKYKSNIKEFNGWFVKSESESATNIGLIKEVTSDMKRLSVIRNIIE